MMLPIEKVVSHFRKQINRSASEFDFEANATKPKRYWGPVAP